MYQDLFANRFTAHIDYAEVLDPWGLGVRIPVRRKGEPAFAEAVRAADGGNKNLINAMARIQTRVQVREMLGGVLASGRAEPETPEGRAARFAAELEGELEREIANLGFDELVENAAQRLNALKPLVAKHLMDDRAGREWSGVALDGQPVAYTLDNRVRFLGFEGARVRLRNGAEDYRSRIELSKPGVDLEVLAEFEGNPRSADGVLYAVGPDQAHGPGYVGDVMTRWILAEAAKVEELLQQAMRGAAATLDTTPGGPSAT